MSKRAEEKALEAWSIYEYREHPQGLYHTCFVDGFKQGYEQAEEDLALTWQDLQAIDDIIVDLAQHTDWPLRGKEEFYTEAVRRFNEQKEGKQ